MLLVGHLIHLPRMDDPVGSRGRLHMATYLPSPSSSSSGPSLCALSLDSPLRAFSFAFPPVPSLSPSLPYPPVYLSSCVLSFSPLRIDLPSRALPLSLPLSVRPVFRFPSRALSYPSLCHFPPITSSWPFFTPPPSCLLVWYYQPSRG